MSPRSYSTVITNPPICLTKWLLIAAVKCLLPQKDTSTPK